MRILIDIDTCTACRLCYDTLPTVFADRGDGIPITLPMKNFPDRNFVEAIKEVMESCPSNSIQMEEVG
uniref:Ferredoxin n=1 Tax=uncultured Aquificia bacterium TaxID=453415 RepID=H5SJL7_9BACT|nr:ferredoxin [uncultured Aquificae bacterium]